MKKPYEKATVKITLFDNSDVVTTSPVSSCSNPGQSQGKCTGNSAVSGDCPDLANQGGSQGGGSNGNGNGCNK